MEDLNKILQEFGLTENEAEVYLALLNLGSATASKIAEKTKIHRVNIYSLLKKLQEKGLVSFVIVGKRKYFESAYPNKILELEEERKEKIRNILPKLKSLRSLEKPYQEATIYKEKKGIKSILEDITKSKTKVYLFASKGGFKEYFPEYADIFHSHLKLNKIKMKCLVSNKLRDTFKIPKPLDYKYLFSEFIFPSSTIVYEDKVIIIMWSAQPIAFLIRNKEISDSYKEYFNILWKRASK